MLLRLLAHCFYTQTGRVRCVDRLTSVWTSGGYLSSAASVSTIATALEDEIRRCCALVWYVKVTFLGEATKPAHRTEVARGCALTFLMQPRPFEFLVRRSSSPPKDRFMRVFGVD